MPVAASTGWTAAARMRSTVLRSHAVTSVMPSPRIADTASTGRSVLDRSVARFSAAAGPASVLLAITSDGRCVRPDDKDSRDGNVRNG